MENKESSHSENPNHLEYLRSIVDTFINEREWKNYHTPKSLAIAISIEAAELLEHFLFKKDDYIPENLEDFEDEIADIFIYLMSLVNTMEIKNFGQIVLRKMQKNRVKYPADKFSGEDYTKQ